MGWTPDAPSLGLAASQDLIAANGGSRFSKKISMIPIAKDDNMGIGARRGTGAGGGLGSIRAMGQPAMGGMGMGFVTASAGTDSAEAQPAPKAGGEFGRLLERLNKAKEAAAAASGSATPVTTAEPSDVDTPDASAVDEGDKVKRKKEKKEKKDKDKKDKKDKKKRRRSDDDVDGDEETSQEQAVALAESLPAETVATELKAAATQAILRNPRMAYVASIQTQRTPSLTQHITQCPLQTSPSKTSRHSQQRLGHG